MRSNISSRISSLLKTRAKKFSFSSSPALSHRRHRLPATLPAKPGLLQLCNGREPTQGFASSLAMRYFSTTPSEDIADQSSNGNHLINCESSLLLWIVYSFPCELCCSLSTMPLKFCLCGDWFWFLVDCAELLLKKFSFSVELYSDDQISLL